MAVNWRVSPAATLAVDGETAIDTSVAGVTVNAAVLDVTPAICAVMLDEPAATVLAKPVPLMVALDVLLEFHDTDEVMSCVGPEV